MITFIVQATDHSEVRQFTDAPDDRLLRYCESRPRAGGWNLMPSIAQYADTMFNSYQVVELIAEIELCFSSMPESHEVKALLAELLLAAQDAERLAGYLFVSGE